MDSIGKQFIDKANGCDIFKTNNPIVDEPYCQ